MNRSFILPVVLLILLLVILSAGFLMDPSEVPSPFINKPAPAFSLLDFKNPNKTLSNQDLLGKVWLVNIWASWCTSCRGEHPLLMALARSGKVSLLGMNYKDRREDALHWLNSVGDPYTLIGADTTGQAGTEWGAEGTPESFLVDQQGIIRFGRAGPLNPDILKNEILPLIERLQSEHPS